MNDEIKNPEQSPVLLLIGGAGTARSRHHSLIENCLLPAVIGLEKLYAAATSHYYKSLGALSVESELIVPPHLGLVPLEHSIKAMLPIIDHKVAKYTGRRIILGGHSLGGIAATRYVHDNPDSEIAEVVTVGSPFSRLSFGIFGLDRWQLEHSTERIHQARTDLGHDAPILTHVASEGDHLVPTDSALPEFDDVTRIVLTSSGTIINGVQTEVVPHAPGHIRIVSHEATLSVFKAALESNPVPEPIAA